MNAGDCSMETAWVVSGDESLVARMTALLVPLADEVRVVDSSEFERDTFWAPRPSAPNLVILDIGDRLDWAVAVIQRLKQVRIRAPIVVVTEDFSRDFGAKILSQGIRYYLGRDFFDQEFHDLVESLLKQPHSPG